MIALRFTKCTGKILGIHRTHCKHMKQALVHLPNERPECNDIKLGDCLRLLRTHRGRTIVLSDRLLITYGKIVNPPRPLLVMATPDAIPRISTLFHCVWLSNTCPSPERLQRQCHRSIHRSVCPYELYCVTPFSPHKSNTDSRISNKPRIFMGLLLCLISSAITPRNLCSYFLPPCVYLVEFTRRHLFVADNLCRCSVKNEAVCVI